MNYHDYKSEDFAANESFQNYIWNNNSEDKSFWENWINENPKSKEDIESAKILLNSISLKVTSNETQLALSQLKQKMKTRNEPIKIESKKNRFLPFIGVAATLIGLLVCIFIFQNKHTPDWTTIKSDFGKLEKVNLPDGSSVFLNSNSSVRFDKNWTTKTYREIWVKGEAYFEVTKNPKKGKQQFIVHAGNAMVEVLGTSFNVYHRKKFTEVALESGSVNFHNKSKKHENYIMKPRDVIRMTDNRKIEQFNEVDLALYTSWKEYKLKLKKTPMIKVINALRDNFGYEVTVQNQNILNRKLTATIPIEDVNILLEALKEIYQLDIKKEGNKIYIK